MKTITLNRKYIISLFSLAIITIICIFAFRGCNDLEPQLADNREVRIEQEQMFKDIVLNYIYELRVQHPYIVYAQAIIESGNFSSKIFKENNNLFGMKLAYQRPTTAIKAQYSHAVYKNWKESVLDYAIWQSIYARNLTEEEYFVKLKSYAMDENYVTLINKVKNNLKNKKYS